MENVRRVIFKAPGMLLFRRCFAVKHVEFTSHGDEPFIVVTHGIFGRRMTYIPLRGSVIRMVNRVA